jgi:hypothetical protein
VVFIMTLKEVIKNWKINYEINKTKNKIRNQNPVYPVTPVNVPDSK